MLLAFIRDVNDSNLAWSLSRITSTARTADFEQKILAFIEYRKPFRYIHAVWSGGADRRICHRLLHEAAFGKLVF
jgi:hypothetical protein